MLNTHRFRAMPNMPRNMTGGGGLPNPRMMANSARVWN